MGIPRRDKASTNEVITHPYPPMRLTNMHLGSNNTHVDIIEATTGTGG